MATSRFAIPELDPNAFINDGPADINASLNAIDADMAGYSQGTFAARPAAGTAGMLYRATDTSQLFMDTGSTWLAVAPDAGAGAYRVVGEAAMTLGAADTAGNYTATEGGVSTLVGGSGVIGAPLAFIPVTLADHAVSGLTTQFRVQAATIVNTIAPAVNFTFALAPITAIGGSGGSISIAIGATLGSFTRSAPLAATSYREEGADFTIAGNNNYVLVVALSGTPAANSRVNCCLRLQVHNI